jgi:hypothetical protein
VGTRRRRRRDILAGQGFSPRTEELAEVWRSPWHEGDPVWLYYINRIHCGSSAHLREMNPGQEPALWHRLKN